MGEFSTIDWALILLRATVGFTLVAHGYGKIFLGGRFPGTVAWFDSIGMRPGWLHARLAATAEVSAGVLFAIGFITPLASAAIVALMVVAAWTVHRGRGFFIASSGWEYNLILAIVALAISITGSGRLSLDHLLMSSPNILHGWPGFSVTAFGGITAGIIHLITFYRPDSRNALPTP